MMCSGSEIENDAFNSENRDNESPLRVKMMPRLVESRLIMVITW